MTNIEIIEKEAIDGSVVEHVIIDNGDGSFTSMLKSTWDELEAAKENGTIS
jgi:hypothetical protein